MTQQEPGLRSEPIVDDFGQPIISETLRRVGLRSWLWVGISVFAVIIVTFLGTLSDLVIPLIVAVVLGMIFEPAVTKLDRWIPRTFAAIVVLVGLVGLILAAIAVVVLGVIGHQPRSVSSAVHMDISSYVQTGRAVS